MELLEKYSLLAGIAEWRGHKSGATRDTVTTKPVEKASLIRNGKRQVPDAISENLGPVSMNFSVM